jgi:ribulose-phosphate 3-epimerase
MTTARIQISPSILSADFTHLEREVKAAQDAGADSIHCDVMDGNFVPNITFGPFVVAAVRRCATIPLDVHLMISSPAKYVDDFCSAGANTLTVHAEACDNLPSVLAKIRGNNVRAGVAVNPDKSVSLFLDNLDKLDQVTIMTVYAGFGGQKFMPEPLGKISEVRNEILRRNLAVDIEVDGGINDTTVVECAKRGATIFVAGSYVFNNPDYAERIAAVRTAAEKALTEIVR